VYRSGRRRKEITIFLPPPRAVLEVKWEEGGMKKNPPYRYTMGLGGEGKR
jgi:hypothetical protein